MATITHENTGDKGQFILLEDDKQIGLMTYKIEGSEKMVIEHTEVDSEHEGKGHGKDLVNEGVAYARAENLKILPLCPFVKKIFEENKEIQDVRA